MWRWRLAAALKPAKELCSSSQLQSLSRSSSPSQMVLQSVCRGRHVDNSSKILKGTAGGAGITYLSRSQHPIASENSQLSYQLNESYGTVQLMHYFCRSFASASSSQPPDKNETETRKDISTAEDPFDSPTYHIPEKPVTFVEGASYGFIILVAIGIAAAAAYGILQYLIFQPKEYKVFNKALERVQNDGQVKVRIGTPIKGFGQDSRNRAARQRIPHRIWKDEDGVEHVEVHFYISGRDGNGKVEARMFKDEVDGEWKFVSLIVYVASPSPARLILESYLPAPA
ncbi:mitochondrial import inner membrane translocase subunit tim21 [Dionaea muscipula]